MVNEDKLNKNKFNMPRIGMRILKTSIAVGLCLLISYVVGIEKPPLAATISTILCMQQHIATSMKISFNRTFGNFVGAFLGLITLYLLWIINIDDILIYYIIVAVLVIPVIYVSLLLKQPETGALSAIAFLCIVISDSSLTTTPFNDAIRRALETVMGVGISLTVNNFHLPRKDENNFLFITKFDQILYKQKEGMTRFCQFELKNLLNSNVPITVVTGRTPAFLEEHLKDIKFKLPIIAMDGAVLYDMNTQDYLDYRYIDFDIVQKIIKELDKLNLNYYVNTIFKGVMFTYHKDFKNIEEENLYKINKKSPYRHYINDDSEIIGSVINISLIISDVDCGVVENTIKNIDGYNNLITIKDSLDLNDGYFHFKIYNNETTNQSMNSMVKHLINTTPQNKIIVFGGDHNDISLIKSADYSYSIKNSSYDIEQLSDSIINCNDINVGDKVLKLIFNLSKPLKFCGLPADIEKIKDSV